MKTQTPSYASLPLILLALLFAALTQCFSQAPAAGKPPVTKVEQLITGKGAATLPKGRTWTEVDVSRASEALTAVHEGQPVEFSLKLNRLETTEPGSEVITYTARQPEFRAAGHRFSLLVVARGLRAKNERVATARQDATVKICGVVKTCKLSGSGESPMLHLDLKDCELR